MAEFCSVMFVGLELIRNPPLRDLKTYERPSRLFFQFFFGAQRLDVGLRAFPFLTNAKLFPYLHQLLISHVSHSCVRRPATRPKERALLSSYPPSLSPSKGIASHALFSILPFSHTVNQLKGERSNLTRAANLFLFCRSGEIRSKLLQSLANTDIYPHTRTAQS